MVIGGDKGRVIFLEHSIYFITGRVIILDSTLFLSVVGMSLVKFRGNLLFIKKLSLQPELVHALLYEFQDNP